MKDRTPPIGETPTAGPDEVSGHGEQRHDEPTVIITNSGKGGAGKTALAHATVHTALALAKRPVIFDLDAANPDLWAGWPEIGKGDRFALQTQSFKGWESVIQTIQSLDASYVVVLDLPANSGTIVDPYLVPMMEAGGYYATLWALDPGRKPMDVLVKYCSGTTMEPVIVAKSAYKTEDGDDDFRVWKQFGDGVDLRGGFVFDVPNLTSAVRVAMVEGGEAAMTVADLATDRGAWSIDRIAKDKENPLRASRARAWLKKMRAEIERAMSAARRIAS